MFHSVVFVCRMVAGEGGGGGGGGGGAGGAGESRPAWIQINPLNNKKANETAAAGQTDSFICVT